MGVDESFAEYVAARWSMLYRLAVLLVGEDGAEDLTRTALVRAYLVWPDVEEAPSADDRVKGILAATAVHEPRFTGDRSGGDPGRDGELAVAPSVRERLWTGIEALPPRQRAVLVLRHYERLTDEEIGRTVGCPTPVVTAEAGALETGVDLDALQEELFGRAEGLDVPLPPIDALVAQSRQARRQRSRRNTVRAVLVAGALVLGIAAAAGVRAWVSDDPAPAAKARAVADVPHFLSALPQGAKPKFAYAVGHFVYLPGGRGIDVGGRPAAVVETPGWVYVAFLSGRIVRIDTDRIEQEPVVSASGGQLTRGPGGGEVAWLASNSGRAAVRLVSTDPTGVGSVDDLRVFPPTLRCCDNPFYINGITAAGELITSLPAESRAWVWDTHSVGEGVAEITGLGNGVISQVTHLGVVVQYPPLQYAVGRVEHGVFLQRAEIVARNADFSDPLGHRIVLSDDTGEVVVRDADVPGRSRRSPPRVRLLLPTLDNGYTAVRWEDSQHVILDLFDASEPDGALVRCDVRSGECELADALEGPHVLAQ